MCVCANLYTFVLSNDVYFQSVLQIFQFHSNGHNAKNGQFQTYRCSRCVDEHKKTRSVLLAEKEGRMYFLGDPEKVKHVCQPYDEGYVTVKFEIAKMFEEASKPSTSGLKRPADYYGALEKKVDNADSPAKRQRLIAHLPGNRHFLKLRLFHSN